MPGIVLEDIDSADPYSAVIAGMRQLIAWGRENEGSMNDTEFKDLIAIEEFIRERSNS